MEINVYHVHVYLSGLGIFKMAGNTFQDESRHGRSFTSKTYHIIEQIWLDVTIGHSSYFWNCTK